jgi:hypothetical protein
VTEKLAAVPTTLVRLAGGTDTNGSLTAKVALELLIEAPLPFVAFTEYTGMASM